jgi:hypothetical protein
MSIKKMHKALVASVLLLSPVAFADGDSSSDARDGFVATLKETDGLIINVPINEKGEELVSEAKTIMHRGGGLTPVSDYATAFTAGESVDVNAAVTETDIASDSATSGWYYGRANYSAYRHYSGPGYYSRNYYNTYYPSYYSYGNYYGYSRPSCRTYYGTYSPYGYYGQRYYYYGRRW